MGISLSQILVIVIIFLLLFGNNKISTLMEDLGKGVRAFKKGLNGDLNGDDNDSHKVQKKEIKKVKTKNKKTAIQKK